MAGLLEGLSVCFWFANRYKLADILQTTVCCSWLKPLRVLPQTNRGCQA